MLASILQWFASFFTSKTASSAATPSASIDIAPGSSYAQAVTDVSGLAKTVIDDVNSPQEIQGRLNAQEQNIKDENANAVEKGLSTGDLSEIERRLS